MTVEEALETNRWIDVPLSSHHIYKDIRLQRGTHLYDPPKSLEFRHFVYNKIKKPTYKWVPDTTPQM